MPVGPAATRSSPPPVGGRAGRPRLHCRTCRPSVAEARRTRSDHSVLTAPCRTCSGPIDHASSRGGRRRLHCHSCRPPRISEPVEDRDQLLERLLATGPSASSATLLQRRVLVAVAAQAEAVSWPLRTTETVLQRLREAVAGDRPDDQRDDHRGGQLVALSAVTAALRYPVWVRFVRDVLDEHDLLLDDTTPSIHTWIDRVVGELPGFGEEVRAWLVELHDGAARARPRLGLDALRLLRSRPAAPDHLVERRASTCARSPTTTSSRRSTRCAGTPGRHVHLAAVAVPVRARRRLVFVDPTRRLHVGKAPRRSVLPLTDDQAAADRACCGDPGAAAGRRAGRRPRRPPGRDPAPALDDIDLAARRITLAGHAHQLVDLLHAALLEWLQERHRAGPTPRTSTCSSRTSPRPAPRRSATSTSLAPARGSRSSNPGADRVLHEAVAVGPIRCTWRRVRAQHATAIDYADLARALLSPARSSTDRPAPDADLQPGSIFRRPGRSVSSPVTNSTRSASGGAEEGRVPTTRVSRRLNSSGSAEQDMRKSMLPPRCGDVVAWGTGAFPGFASRQRVPRTCAFACDHAETAAVGCVFGVSSDNAGLDASRDRRCGTVGRGAVLVGRACGGAGAGAAGGAGRGRLDRPDRRRRRARTTPLVELLAAARGRRRGARSGSAGEDAARLLERLDRAIDAVVPR